MNPDKHKMIKELKGKFYLGVKEEEVFLTLLKIAIDNGELAWEKKTIIATDELSQQCSKIVLHSRFKGHDIQFVKFKACFTDKDTLGAYKDILRGYIILIDNRVSEIVETGLLGHLFGSYKNLFSKASLQCRENEQRIYKFEVNANSSNYLIGNVNLNNLVTAGLI